MNTNKPDNIFDNQHFLQAYSSHIRVSQHAFKTVGFFTLVSGLGCVSAMYFLFYSVTHLSWQSTAQALLFFFMFAAALGAGMSIVFQEHALKISRFFWPQFKHDLKQMHEDKLNFIKGVFLKKTVQANMLKALEEIIRTREKQKYYPELVKEFELLKYDLMQTNYSKSFFCLLRMHHLMSFRE